MDKVNTKASAIRVARSLEAHSLLAVVFGALIYILAITGTLSVFNHELQRWEQPNAPEMERIAPEAAERAALAVFAAEPQPTTHLYINFPQEDLPRTVITTDTQAFFARADGSIAGREHFPWTQFLLDLHYYLHLPHVLGLTVVGALGVMLLVLALSGLIAHPRIFRDAFALRRGAGRLTLVDLHNRMGVWTLPFHLSNALTGAILGLASVLALVIAAAGFDNDRDAVFAPTFGAEPAADARLAPVAKLARPLAFMAERFPALDVAHVVLHDPGTVGQHTEIIAEHPDRLIFGDYYLFDPAGAYRGNVGISDGTVGQQVTGAVYNVHFGNWGGVPVKLAYLVFGLVLCVIVASGLAIYFSKREARGQPAPQLAGAWQGVVWGTPALLATTMAAALLGLEGLGLVCLFWGGLAVLIAVCAWTGAQNARLGTMGFTAAALLIALAIHAGRFGVAAVSQAGLAISLAGAVLIAILAIMAVRQLKAIRISAPKSAPMEAFPAE